ncbi:hypothetical protein PSTT_16810, partial [Puccinia striiformis]
MKLNRLPLSCLPSSQVRFATSRRISSLGNEEYQKINFYSNSHVLRYAEMEAVPFSLRQLIFFGKVLGRHGSNVEELDHSLVQGANFTRVQLPIRLARQIREFQSLPYIVTSNSYLTETYQIYVDAFEKIRSYPEIRCRQDNLKWCQFLESLLNEHKIVIPKLAIGVAESANHLTNSQIEQFMTRMLYSRISRRTNPIETRPLDNFRYLGVIDTELEIGKVVEKCIGLAQSTLNLKNSSPYSSKPVSVLVHGQKNAKFAYIADHLEREMFSFVNLTTANDSLKQLISSTDGIMEGKVREQVEVNHQQIPPSSSQSSTSSASSNNIDGFEQIQEARLRIGLPLSSIYAQFLGGSLEMYSMKGFSSIVLSIPKLGTTNEPYN